MTSSNSIAETIIERAVSRYPVLEGWLFGSRARGDNRPDSDWDVFLVLENEAFLNWEEKRVLRDGLNVGVDIVDVDLNDAMESEDIGLTIPYQVKREGILLYSRLGHVRPTPPTPERVEMRRRLMIENYIEKTGDWLDSIHILLKNKETSPAWSVQFKMATESALIAAMMMEGMSGSLKPFGHSLTAMHQALPDTNSLKTSFLPLLDLDVWGDIHHVAEHMQDYPHASTQVWMQALTDILSKLKASS